ncbi:MAG: type II/IV secretion system ATPase subunit [Candidatus Methanomethylicia archaeon]
MKLSIKKKNDSSLEQLIKKLRSSKKKSSESTYRVEGIGEVKVVYPSLEGKNIIEKYTIPNNPVEIFITDQGEYLVCDPPLSEEQRKKLVKFMSDLIYLLPDDITLSDIEKTTGILTDVETYLVTREVFGWSVLDPLIRDPRVEDVNITSAYAPVLVTHSTYGNLTSNIYFDSEEEVLRLAEKLVHRCGKTISFYHPLSSIRTPEGHRLTVTYGREVSHTGTSIVVRKFPEFSWSITMQMVRNTIDPVIAAYFMMLIENRLACIIYGVMSSGKTSMVNSLCNLIPANARIGTIEDTAELRLAHPYWKPLVVRESYTVDKRGEISQFDLVKHSLRMSLDYIVVGEVRGREGIDWAQAVLTGHGGITSFHAGGPEEVIQRFTSPPISLSLGGLMGVYSMGHMMRLVKEEKDGRRSFVRRMIEVHDVSFSSDSYDIKLFARYDPSRDTFLHISNDEVIKLHSMRRIMELRGWDESRLIEELHLREAFLTFLRDKAKIDEAFLDYQVVTRAIWKFYEDPSYFQLENKVPLGRKYMQSIIAIKP